MPCHLGRGWGGGLMFPRTQWTCRRLKVQCVCVCVGGFHLWRSIFWDFGPWKGKSSRECRATVVSVPMVALDQREQEGFIQDFFAGG